MALWAAMSAPQGSRPICAPEQGVSDYLCGCVTVNRVFLKHLSICGNGTFYHTLCFNITLHHLTPLNSTQTPRHLLSHHCGKADGEFERRDSCRSAAASCEGLRRSWPNGGGCRFPNQLFLNHLPPPIHPHCSRMVPRPYQCAAGAWRPSKSCLGTWNGQIARRSRQTRR